MNKNIELFFRVLSAQLDQARKEIEDASPFSEQFSSAIDRAAQLERLIILGEDLGITGGDK